MRAVFEKKTRNPAERIGDLNAQVGANRLGVSRCIDFISRYGERAFDQFVEAVIDYTKSRVTAHLSDLPDGEEEAIEYLDGEDEPIPIRVKIRIQGASFDANFTGTAPQSPGNANTPLSVTRSAVYYVLRCFLPSDIPPNHGCYESVKVTAPEGSLLNQGHRRQSAPGMWRHPRGLLTCSSLH